MGHTICSWFRIRAPKIGLDIQETMEIVKPYKLDIDAKVIVSYFPSVIRRLICLGYSIYRNI
jgi:hypothetical protein